MGKPLLAVAPTATCTLQYEGRLVENAHAAQRPTDHQGHFAPTLCFSVVMALGQHIDVQQFFPVGHDDECKVAAARMRKGQVYSFHVGLEALRLVANGVSHVRHVSDAPDLFAPAPSPAPAELQPVSA
ncbi:hypothetical protein [Polaromonas sp.]|uniref:hypothetical protein n=1 Tax=Polaromonas sp. TaxID=1869339 RepID=UPI003566AC98